MSINKKDILILSGLVLLAFTIWVLTLGQSAFDIQLYDTYFVIEKAYALILLFGPLSLVIFLVRAWMQKFKSIGANAGLIIGLILVSFITYKVIEIEKSYLTELKSLSSEDLPDRGQFYADMKSRITFTWALFGLWLTSIALLTIRTIRLWRKGYRQPT